MRLRCLLMAAMVALPVAAFAQDDPSSTLLTTTSIPAAQGEAALGRQFRGPVQNAIRLSMAGDHAAAIPMLAETIRYCDAQQAVAGRKALSFQSQRQYALYMAGPGHGTPTEWLDMACAKAYNHLGYIEIDRSNVDAALAWLDKAIAVAPYDAEPLCERGAALTRRGDWQGSQDAYAQALVLARSHPENRRMEAMALRGVGFAHIELGDLSAARAAYLASQKIDPDSPTAKNELAYIQQLEDQKNR